MSPPLTHPFVSERVVQFPHICEFSHFLSVTDFLLHSVVFRGDILYHLHLFNELLRLVLWLHMGSVPVDVLRALEKHVRPAAGGHSDLRKGGVWAGCSIAHVSCRLADSVYLFHPLLKGKRRRLHLLLLNCYFSLRFC